MTEREETAWTPLETADGSWTLVSRRLGEACHSRDGAWSESLERYAVPCRLRERARTGTTVRLLDVGTGLGLNLAAALAELEGSGAHLEVDSLEEDPAVVRAALALGERVPVGGPGERHHQVVRVALGRALVASGADPVPLGTEGSLRLHTGDARECLPHFLSERCFDAVFLDPFSPRRDPALWDELFLGRVARCMAPGAVLSTYTAAFRVRLGLARAGLVVGLGPPVGSKREGTLAASGVALPAFPPGLTRRLEEARQHPPAPRTGNRGGGPGLFRTSARESPPGDGLQSRS